MKADWAIEHSKWVRSHNSKKDHKCANYASNYGVTFNRECECKFMQMVSHTRLNYGDSVWPLQRVCNFSYQSVNRNCKWIRAMREMLPFWLQTYIIHIHIFLLPNYLSSFTANTERRIWRALWQRMCYARNAMWWSVVYYCRASCLPFHFNAERVYKYTNGGIYFSAMWATY